MYDQRGNATADLLSLDTEDPRQENELFLHHPSQPQAFRRLGARFISEIEPLLIDVMVDGKIVYEQPSIEDMRALRDRDLERLDSGVKRIMFPHIYHVSLTHGLWKLKQELIQELYPAS